MKKNLITTLIGILAGICGAMLCALLPMNEGVAFKLRPFLAFLGSSLIGWRIAVALKGRNNFRWVLYVAIEAGFGVALLIHGGCSWLPQFLKDCGPYLREHLSSDNTWVAVFVFGWFGFLFLFCVGSGSAHGSISTSSPDYSQSPGTPSYDPPVVSSTPTWRFEAPPSPPLLTDDQVRRDAEYRGAQAQDDWNKRFGQ